MRNVFSLRFEEREKRVMLVAKKWEYATPRVKETVSVI